MRDAKAARFRATDDARFPFEAVVDGERWRVRINEFPAAPTPYTLFVDDVPVLELMDWPALWLRPEDDPAEKAAFEHEVAAFARSRGIAPASTPSPLPKPRG